MLNASICIAHILQGIFTIPHYSSIHLFALPFFHLSYFLINFKVGNVITVAANYSGMLSINPCPIFSLLLFL